MIKLRILLQSNLCYGILVCITILYVTIYCFIPRSSIYKGNEKKLSGIISEHNKEDTKMILITKNKEKILVYYQKNNNNQNNFQIGDKIILYGEMTKPQQNTIFGLFNYQGYLYHKYIYRIFYASKMVKIEGTTKIQNWVRNSIIDYLERIDTTHYISLLIFGIKNEIDLKMMESYRMNGFIHLFSVSGTHVMLISTTLLWILKKGKIELTKSYLLISSMLFFFGFLIQFPVSFIRSLLYFLLVGINKIYYLKITSMRLYLISLLIPLWINPYVIFDLGFQYSYLIVFYFILGKRIIRKYKNRMIKGLIISFIAFFSSLPLVLCYNAEFNILSPFLNVIFIIIVTYILFPIAVLSIIFPWLNELLQFLVHQTEQISLFFSKIGLFQITYGKPNLIFLLIYYILWSCIIYYRKKEGILLLLVLLIINYQLRYINPDYKITFLDVGQGDLIVMQFPYQRQLIVIDTGGKYTRNKEKFSDRTLIPYLKMLGYSKISYLLLTHGDYDHMGEAINLVENFKVENVIFNCGPYNDLEQELIKVLDKKKIRYYSCIKELNIDKYKLSFLNIGEYDNENDNSSVIYFNYNNYKFLFMGDAGINREKDILNKYNLTDIDFLKVGHHGSNTGTSEYFVESIKPKNCLISVGKNNRYGHPKETVLYTLKDCNIYRTDLNGSIEIKLNKNGYSIKSVYNMK